MEFCGLFLLNVYKKNIILNFFGFRFNLDHAIELYQIFKIILMSYKLSFSANWIQREKH